MCHRNFKYSNSQEDVCRSVPLAGGVLGSFFFFLIVSVLLTIVVVVGISYCTSSELSDRGLTEGRPRSVASCMGRHSTGPMEKESAAICLTLPIAAMFILSVI